MFNFLFGMVTGALWLFTWLVCTDRYRPRLPYRYQCHHEGCEFKCFSSEMDDIDAFATEHERGHR